MAIKGKQRKGMGLDVTGVVDKLASKKATEKASRTLLLNNANFEWFQEYCRSINLRPAHVVDEWIKDLRANNEDM